MTLSEEQGAKIRMGNASRTLCLFIAARALAYSRCALQSSMPSVFSLGCVSQKWGTSTTCTVRQANSCISKLLQAATA